MDTPSGTSQTNKAQISRHQLLEHLSREFTDIKRATHCMYAWRTRIPSSIPPSQASNSAGILIPKVRTGAILTGSSDGGEAGAGERLHRLLDLGQYEDVIVVVYRWF